MAFRSAMFSGLVGAMAMDALVAMWRSLNRGEGACEAAASAKPRTARRALVLKSTASYTLSPPRFSYFITILFGKLQD